jgi:hypothetical protein
VFIGNKLQLTGPVPPQLRHEFVGYRPFITWMFDSQGLRGNVLNRALHKQYRTVYSYDRNTRYGVVQAPGEDAEDAVRAGAHSGEEVGDTVGHPAGAKTGDADDTQKALKDPAHVNGKDGQDHGTTAQDNHGNDTQAAADHDAPARPGEQNTDASKADPAEHARDTDTDTGPRAAGAHARALALQFLRMCAFGAGGRLFTYVLTLDGEWRWTETGAEFAVDLLSKHTMHADVSRAIAWSGEFFVRRRVDAPGGGFPSAVKVEDGSIVQEVEEEKRKAKEAKAGGDDGKGKDKGGDPKKQKDGEQHKSPEQEEEDEEHEEQADADDEEVIEDPSLYELVIDNDSGT